MLWFIWLLLKIAITPIVAFLVFSMLKRYRMFQRAKFYEAQGFRKLQGFDNFPLGNISFIIDYETKMKP